MLGVCTVYQNINKNLWSCIEETGGEGGVWIYLAVNKVPIFFFFYSTNTAVALNKLPLVIFVNPGYLVFHDR